MNDKPFDIYEARTTTAQMESRMLQMMMALASHANGAAKGMSESQLYEMTNVARSAIPKLQVDLDIVKQCLAIWDTARKDMPDGCTADDIKWKRIS